MSGKSAFFVYLLLLHWKSSLGEESRPSQKSLTEQAPPSFIAKETRDISPKRTKRQLVGVHIFESQREKVHHDALPKFDEFLTKRDFDTFGDHHERFGSDFHNFPDSGFGFEVDASGYGGHHDHGYKEPPKKIKPIPYKGPRYDPYDLIAPNKSKKDKKSKYGDDPVNEAKKGHYHPDKHDLPIKHFGGFGGGGSIGYNAGSLKGGGFKGQGGGGFKGHGGGGFKGHGGGGFKGHGGGGFKGHGGGGFKGHGGGGFKGHGGGGFKGHGGGFKGHGGGGFKGHGGVGFKEYGGGYEVHDGHEGFEIPFIEHGGLKDHGIGEYDNFFDHKGGIKDHGKGLFHHKGKIKGHGKGLFGHKGLKNLFHHHKGGLKHFHHKGHTGLLKLDQDVKFSNHHGLEEYGNLGNFQDHYDSKPALGHVPKPYNTYDVHANFRVAETPGTPADVGLMLLSDPYNPVHTRVDKKGSVL